MWRYLTAVAVATCLCSFGCGPTMVTPDAAMFSGETGGCGSCFVYRFNDAKTLAITVLIGEEAIPASESRATFQIGSATGIPQVHVLQFRGPAVDYFCDDVGGDPRPIATWTAVAGEIEFERVTATPPAKVRNATHRVSVVLKNLQLKNDQTGVTISLGDVQLKDVWVGWLAG